MVTQQQIAQASGVTRATVSYVLAGRAAELKISREVVDRVETAARELGYAPSHAGQALVTGRSRTIGLILGSGDDFWGRIAEGVEAEAFARGYDLLLIHGGDDAQSRARRLLGQRRVDGLIVLGTFSQQVSATWSQLQAPPVVIHARGGRGLPGVELDGSAGMSEAVDHLWTLGHRQIMFVQPAHLQFNVGSDRLIAVQQRGREHGITVVPCSVDAKITREHSLDQRIAAWSEAIRHAVPGPRIPSAVICWNDLIALGLYAVLQERGLRVGRDVSVVGFDDHHAAAALPAMTTVSYQSRELGQAAARIAVDIASGALPPNEAIQTIIRLPARLIIRQSTGPASRSMTEGNT